ncbi:hypothetical protein [Streptomyces sp. ISL-94]|uniref:hypothetical protein n=1 Tax=Streptomyces sp. ISL-94 TaxID=2819190 RepID=UPI001BEAA3F9|nr:hypothetical protein [Streptomyces sp. ISL-94]MBT2478507.1 hypothetical protein [Streptomyces sp. ISL-94]
MSVRTASAIAVVAGVVTTLLPLSATAASAADEQALLRTEMSTPVPSGPLSRGGATETFELTVKNPSGKALKYNPWMIAQQSGPSPLQKDDIVFKVDALDAPATKYMVGQQDGGWQGMFYPASGSGVQSGFDIPANGKMTWKVTVGLGANYPTNDGDFRFTASSLSSTVDPKAMGSHLFKVDPQIKLGRLKTWFKQVSSGKDGQEQRAYLNLNYQATGDGAFAEGLATSLILTHPGQEKADFRLQALIDGRWQDLKFDDGQYELPVIPKGFGAGSGVRTQELRLSLGKDTKLKKKTTITMEARIRLANGGNTYPFEDSSVQFPLAPITEPTPAVTPSAPPAKTPSGTTKVEPASATSSSAVAAGNTNLTTTTGSATGSLASTGSDSAMGLYAGLAAALVALGAAAAWLGARRRRATTA